MARAKKVIKLKEPIKLRQRKLANGNYSLYLDKYVKGVREYEYLGLYLVPEIDDTSRQANVNTLKAANAIKAQRLLEHTNEVGGVKSTSTMGKMLLLDWVDIVREQKRKKGYSENRCQGFKSTKRHLETYIGGKSVRLCDVDKNFILGFIDYLANAKMTLQTRKEENLSKSAAKYYFSTFRTTLKEAKRLGYISANPMEEIGTDDKNPIKAISKKREYLTKEEVKKLQNVVCVENDTLNSFMFSCFTGLRLSDIKALTWGDIVETGIGKEVVITMQKTKEIVHVPILGDAKKWLPRRKNTASDNNLVFDIPTLGAIDRRLKKFAAKVGINKNVSFHTARHTFATLCLTSGADLYTTSKLLGHTNIKTTQIYADIINQKKVDAVRMISDYFNKD